MVDGQNSFINFPPRQNRFIIFLFGAVTAIYAEAIDVDGRVNSNSNTYHGTL